MELGPAVTTRRSGTLARAQDVRRVLNSGRRHSGHLVAVHVMAADGETRIGFASSRAVGGAVARNRARRLMREAWRVLAGRASGGHWIMMVARAEIAASRIGEVIADMESTLVRAGVIE